MPTPIPYSPVPNVAPSLTGAPQQQVSASPDAFGAGVGRAEQDLGAGLTQAGEQAGATALHIADMNAETNARNANATFIPALSKAWADYSQLEGQNAAEGLPAFQSHLLAIQQNTASSLPSPLAQKMFLDQSSYMINRMGMLSASHAAEQTKKSWTQGYQANIDNMTNYSVLMRNDPHSLDTGAESVRDSADRLSVQQGAPPQMAEALRTKALGSYWTHVIAAVAQDPGDGPARAAALLDRVAPQMDAQSVTLLRQHLHGALDRGLADQAVTRSMSVPLTGPVPTMIVQAASAAGVTPVHALAVAKIESDLGQRPDTPGNVHTGIFQTGPEEKVAYRGPVSPVTGVPTPHLTTVTAPGGAAFRVDESAAPKFQGLVADLAAEGIKVKPETSGGYNDRFIAGTHTPSQHARGLAVDINWDENPNGEGKPSAIPAELANRLAQKWGLTWGGNWSGKDRDPMHFEVSQPPGPDRSEEIATGVNGLKHAAQVADTALGRPSEPWEQYVTYQHGDTGGPLLLKSNPTISVVDALAPAYGGDKARALQKIVANGGTADMTAGQFTGMWRAKYQDAEASVGGQPVPGNAAPPPSPQSEASVMQAILDDPTLKDRPEAQERALTLARTRFSIIRQERVDAAEKAGSSLVSQMLKDPLQIKLADIADNPSFTGEQKWSLSRMWNEAVAGTRGDKQATEYGPGIYKYLQMVVPQPSRQEAAPLNQLGQSTGPAQTVGGGPALNDPTELWSKVPTGELTIAGVEKLTSIMQGSKTMEGQNDNRMLTQFIDATKTLISKHGASNGFMKDPKGEQLFVDFLTQALPAFAAGRQAGIPAASLVNSESKEFIGKIIPHYIRTDAQILKDLHDANGADDKPAAEEAGVDLTTSAGIMAAFEGKKVSYARAERALELLGVPHAQPAAPAPPTAVPTGQ